MQLPVADTLPGARFGSRNKFLDEPLQRQTWLPKCSMLFLAHIDGTRIASVGKNEDFLIVDNACTNLNATLISKIICKNRELYGTAYADDIDIWLNEGIGCNGWYMRHADGWQSYKCTIIKNTENGCNAMPVVGMNIVDFSMLLSTYRNDKNCYFLIFDFLLLRTTKLSWMLKQL